MAQKIYGVPDRSVGAPVGVPDRKRGMPKGEPDADDKKAKVKGKVPAGVARRGRPDAAVC